MKKKLYKVSVSALIFAENEVDAEMLFEKIKEDKVFKDVREATPKDYLPEALIN
jgi:hypothetical protein